MLRSEVGDEGSVARGILPAASVRGIELVADPKRHLANPRARGGGPRGLDDRGRIPVEPVSLALRTEPSRSDFTCFLKK